MGGGERGFAFFFFQAEDGIRGLVRSRGLGDVYKWQVWAGLAAVGVRGGAAGGEWSLRHPGGAPVSYTQLTLPTSLRV